MQSNIYAKLKEVCNELDDNKITILKDFLQYQFNSYISYNDIANKINISSSSAKKIINELIKADIIDMCFKLCCNNEMDMDDRIYNDIRDIPDEKCDGCEKGCSILKNVIVLYKVGKVE